MVRPRATSALRPGLERLESRDCLAMPTLSGCGLQYMPDREAIVSGYVTDESPETATVTFSGVVDATTVTPDATGYFEKLLTVNDLGAIEIRAADEESYETPIREIMYGNVAPIFDNVTLSWDGVQWSLEGHVDDEAPDGLKVTVTWTTFGNLSFATVDVNSQGDFAITFYEAPPSKDGEWLYLSITDWWESTDDTQVHGQ